MEDSLDSHFPWNNLDILCGNENNCFILCTDSESNNAEFSFVMSLIKLLKKGKQILLVCGNHSRTHYEHILKKNGIDLRSLELRHKMCIKELIIQPPTLGVQIQAISWTQLNNWQIRGMDFPFTDESFTAAPSDSFIADNVNDGNGIERIPSHDETFTLMIDDLEVLDIIASNTEIDAKQFLSRCINNLYNNTTPCNGLICFGRKVVNPAYDSSNNMMLSSSEYCRYRADILIDVSPLATGYSADTHGIIRVTSRNRFPTAVTTIKLEGISDMRGRQTAVATSDTKSWSGSNNASRIWQQSMLFKALDTGVKCSIIKKNLRKS